MGCFAVTPPQLTLGVQPRLLISTPDLSTAGTGQRVTQTHTPWALKFATATGPPDKNSMGLACGHIHEGVLEPKAGQNR